MKAFTYERVNTPAEAALSAQRFTGAEFIVHFLEQQGIKIVTGIPGGSILPVYDALSQSTQIRHSGPI